MTPEFEKIAENFTVDWNLDNILTKFVECDSSHTNLVYSSPDGNPHWQNFLSGISFARNFYKNFTNECIEVADKLTLLQYSLSSANGSKLLELFLNHRILPYKVNLTKIPPGSSVAPHVDSTRNVCINIGLRNSNSCRTYVSDVNHSRNFWEQNLKSYVMEDGHVYMLSVKKSHALINISTNSNVERYVITYNML